jgi:hypothetical protein
MAATDAYVTLEELLEAEFSVRSVPRSSCDYESIETAVRRVGGWCEMAASLGVS